MPDLTDQLNHDQDHLRNEHVDHSANVQLADAQPANLQHTDAQQQLDDTVPLDPNDTY